MALGCQGVVEGGEQISVFFVGLELGELFFYVVGGVEEVAGVGFAEHRCVVEGIAGGGDVVVEAF